MNEAKPDICNILQAKIAETLTPLIDSDFIYLDLPYHSNIGDTLIWMGADQFLRSLPHTCLGQHSIATFDFRPLPHDAVILLHGGGNFGDLWRKHQDFRLRVISTYPGNRIIVLPQTIHYDSPSVMASDIQLLNRHPQLTICVRDDQSAEQMKQNGFTGQLLLLPDMAFCINKELLIEQKSKVSKEAMLVLRADKEAPKGRAEGDLPAPRIDIKDWPNQRKNRHTANDCLRKNTTREADELIQTQFFPYLVSEGVRFVSEYRMVYTTRLHVAILRLLLGMPVKIMNNSYGKNLSFYDTWLKDAPLIDIPDEKEQKWLNQVIWQYQKKQKYRKLLKRTCVAMLIVIVLMVLTLWLFSIYH